MPKRPLLAAATFNRAYEAWGKNLSLLDAVDECIERLQVNYRHPGLNAEQLYFTKTISVHSARIDQQFRLIYGLTAVKQLYLLFFHKHEEAYYWAQANRDRITRVISQAPAWEGRFQLDKPHGFLRLHDDQPIPFGDVKALRRMLSEGMHRYLAFLDPTQRSYATFNFAERSGLMFVTGGAGTGKTAIAIHRALHLSREQELERQGVLYLCFNRLLAKNVLETVRSLGAPDVQANLRVSTFHKWCWEYLKLRGIPVSIPSDDTVKLREAIRRSLKARGFEGLLSGISDFEIAQEVGSIKRIGIVEAQDYAGMERTGRGFSLRQPQRAAIWQTFEDVRYEKSGIAQFDDLPSLALKELTSDQQFKPFRAVIVDEAQDCGPVLARLVRRLVQGDDRRIMVLADEAQAIYRNGYQLAKKEFRPRGAQSVVLRKPYRSTREIYAFASSIYAGNRELAGDLDEIRHGTRSGPKPVVVVNPDQKATDDALIERIRQEHRTTPSREKRMRETAVLVGTGKDADHVLQVLRDAGLQAERLDRYVGKLDSPSIKVLVVHSSKGLDFPSIYIYRLNTWGDEATAEERALLYVAMTRSSFRLTVLCDKEALSPLFRDIDPQTYELSGLTPHLLEVDEFSVARK